MAKTDRRVRYTKQIIRRSLFEMLRTVPIDQVTVKALCERAEINRATFYSHYETLGALLLEIEAEESEELFTLLEMGQLDRNHVERTIERVIRYLKLHPAMRELFLSRNTPVDGLLHTGRERQHRIIKRIADESDISLQQAEWMLVFVVSGVREVLRRWFETGMQDEALLKDTLVAQILGGFQSIIKN